MKKTLLSLIAACVSLAAMAQKPAFVTFSSPSETEQTAQAWFETEVQGDVYTVEQISALDAEQNPVVWIMVDRIGLDRGAALLPDGIAAVAQNSLKAYVQNGGNIILTNHATQLATSLGRIPEAYAPGIYGNGGGGQNPDVWGTQPVIGNAEGQIYDHTDHPIYKNMEFKTGLYERGIYPFIDNGHKLDHNCMWDLNAYGLAPEPNVVKTWETLTNSLVLGTWNHVVDYCCAGIVEFLPTTECKGTILCVGLASYDWNCAPYGDNMKVFTKNMLEYLTPEVTAVEKVSATTSSAAFNLAGQRVNDNAKGLVIKSGKKHLTR